MPTIASGIERKDLIKTISLLIDNLLNIRDETGKYLLKLDDGRVVDTKGWGGWDWTHGIGLYGIYKYYELTRDEKAFSIIKQWFEDHFNMGTVNKNVNTMSPFLTLAYLYEDTGDKTYVPYLDAWLDWIMHGIPRTEENGIQHTTYELENRQQLWDDTLMMSVMPLAKSGMVFGRKEYIEEAKRQFLLHIKYLQDRKTGLWFHGWCFEGRHNFGNVLWARGNCWVTMAITDFLELLQLDEKDPIGSYLLESLNNQAEALMKYQDESGLWHTILNDASSYLEASATAGFAYGLLKAVRKHYINEKFKKVGVNAVKGILKNISPDGELKNVSFGTPVFNSPEEYKNVPLTSMPYGQALAVLCLSEFLHEYI